MFLIFFVKTDLFFKFYFQNFMNLKEKRIYKEIGLSKNNKKENIAKCLVRNNKIKPATEKCLDTFFAEGL